MKTPMRSAVLIPALFVVALGACGDAASEPTAAVPRPKDGTTTTTSTTTSPAIPPVVGDPLTGDHVSDGFPGSGAPAYLSDVDYQTYEPFTRIVFEFDGPAPEFAIEYLDGFQLTKRPSDQPVDLAGDKYLVVTMAPASGVDLTGDEAVETYTGPTTIALPSDVVRAMTEIEDFESHLGWAVGLEYRVSYSVTTLTDPTRLVIDLHTRETTSAVLRGAA